jgi:solute:Na+ symporter, SSS family
MTGVLAAKDAKTVARNMAFLPAYTFALGLLALLGFMAVAAGVAAKPEFAPYFKQYAASFAVPALILQSFPAWFVGVAFSAIVIGALVPAAIMSIAAANLFTRNVYKEYINPAATGRQESNMAKLASLVLKFIALIFVLELPNVYAIQFQLLGGIWISQIIPATVFGLYTRWFHRGALILGWIVGMASGTWMAWSNKFASSIYPVHAFGYEIPCYAAVSTLILNVAVAAVFTLVFRAMKLPEGRDSTAPADYRLQR